MSETDDADRIRENLKWDLEDYADHAVAAVASPDVSDCYLFHANAALAVEGESMSLEIAR